MTNPPENGEPETLASHAPGGDLLPPSPRRGRRGLVAALVVVVLLAVAGAGYAGYAAILKPHGASPEEATPANAVAFGKVDLDPAAQQKLAVYRLAKRFPDTKVKSDKSIKDDLLKAVFASAGDAIDYEKDIKPWIGKRAAIAAIPGAAGEDPHPLIVVQYDDKDRARTSLDRLTKKANADTPEDPVYFAFSDVDGYALLSDTQAAADGAARAKNHLNDEKAYKSAVAALKGDQIVTVWADAARVYAVVPKDELQGNPFFSIGDLKPAGQVVLGAHAESNAIELVGKTLGLTSGLSAFNQSGLASGTGTNMVQSFPDSSALAFSATGLGAALASLYTANEKTLRELDAFGIFDLIQHAGVSLPGDFTAVLGTEVAGFFAGSNDRPHFAIRVKTANAARAEHVISSLVSQATGNAVPLDELYATAPGGYVVGAPAGMASLASGGHLGTTKIFTDAVPDADGAPFVLFVDLRQAIDISGDDVPKEVRQVRAVGVTVRSVGHDTSFRLRVTFD